MAGQRTAISKVSTGKRLIRGYISGVTRAVSGVGGEVPRVLTAAHITMTGGSDKRATAREAVVIVPGCTSQEVTVSESILPIELGTFPHPVFTPTSASDKIPVATLSHELE
ncbi:hypothetical protein J6590_061724 [Homalodisca vitripennis]|nr:hypothetical protein J6590_061724 [Homalodisca vitripennis]